MKFSSCQLFKMEMVVRMISGNIAIPHHPTPCPPHSPAWGGVWGIVIVLYDLYGFESIYIGLYWFRMTQFDLY